METWTYPQFLNYMRTHWHSGEHVAPIGPTGSGKTFLTHDLLVMRQYSVLLATKAKDETIDAYDMPMISFWPPDYYQQRVIVWAKAKRLGDFGRQRALAYRVMDDVYRVGGWTLGFDDVFYISQTLGLKSSVQMLYTQVRSMGVSLIGNMQRPAWNPLEVLSQSTYLLVFRIRDKMDIKRVAEGNGLDSKELEKAIQELEKYQFLLLETGKPPVRIEKAERT